jgi:hypothetical protein
MRVKKSSLGCRQKHWNGVAGLINPGSPIGLCGETGWFFRGYDLVCFSAARSLDLQPQDSRNTSVDAISILRDGAFAPFI